MLCLIYSDACFEAQISEEEVVAVSVAVSVVVLGEELSIDDRVQMVLPIMIPVSQSI